MFNDLLLPFLDILLRVILVCLEHDGFSATLRFRGGVKLGFRIRRAATFLANHRFLFRVGFLYFLGLI